MPKHGEQPELARILGYTSQSILYGFPPTAVAFGNDEIFATNGSGGAITPTISDGNLVGKLNALGTIGSISMANLLGANMLDWHFVRKSANESVTSSTTLQDDDELLFSAAANTDYIFDMYVDFTAHASGDMKFDFTGPSGASINLGEREYADILDDQGADHISAFSTADTAAGQGAFHVFLRFHGTISIAGTAGTVQFRWAQNASHGTATIVYAGSYLRAMKVH